MLSVVTLSVATLSAFNLRVIVMNVAAPFLMSQFCFEKWRFQFYVFCTNYCAPDLRRHDAQEDDTQLNDIRSISTHNCVTRHNCKWNNFKRNVTLSIPSLLLTVALKPIMLSLTILYYHKCHFTKCQNDECHFTECQNDVCHYARYY